MADWRLLISGVCGVAAFVAGNAAQAAAFISTTIASDLTLLSIDTQGTLDGFAMSWDAVSGDFMFEEGNAEVESSQGTFIAEDDPLGLGVGFDLTAEILVDAEAEPVGEAAFAVDEIALLTFSNSTNNDVTVLWGVNVFVDSFAGFTGSPALNEAFVGSSLDVFIDGEEALFFSAFGDTLDIPEQTVDGFEVISIVINAGSSRDVELVLLTEGFVVSEVPVAGAFPLFLTAAACFGGLRRKRS